MSKNQLNIEELFQIIKEKTEKKDPNSYSYKLSQAGLDLISRKVGEEAVEVVVASFIDEKNNNEQTREELIGELCDLFYHSLVLMNQQKINPEDIFKEFARRNNKNT